MSKKEPSERSGRSKDRQLPFGKRRTGEGGKERAPRSLRKKGRTYMSDCTKKELLKAEVIEETYEEEKGTL